MSHLHMITFLMYHNSTMVYAISAQNGDVSDIDDMARTLCEKRGGVVNVYANDDSSGYWGDWWEFAYINSGDRTWKVTQDDMWEWEERWEMSEDFPYPGCFDDKMPKTRLEVGKWLTMGEHVREFFPGVRRVYKKERVRKQRRQARDIIQEQMM